MPRKPVSIVEIEHVYKKGAGRDSYIRALQMLIDYILEDEALEQPVSEVDKRIVA